MDSYTLEPRARFDYQHGVQIGPRDFAQVYAGDVDGVAPDDVVAVYEDGAVEVFLTKYAPDEPLRRRVASASTRSASCSAPAWPPSQPSTSSARCMATAPRAAQGLWVHLARARRFGGHGRHGRLPVGEPARDRAHRGRAAPSPPRWPPLFRKLTTRRRPRPRRRSSRSQPVTVDRPPQHWTLLRRLTRHRLGCYASYGARCRADFMFYRGTRQRALRPAKGLPCDFPTRHGTSAAVGFICACTAAAS